MLPECYATKIQAFAGYMNVVNMCLDCQGVVQELLDPLAPTMVQVCLYHATYKGSIKPTLHSTMVLL